jgi:ABC-type transport system involved in multi-copper enzyme maturation permease subunit
MRLFGSEMTRLASRRLFRWLLILFIGLLLVGAVLVFVNDQEGTFTRADMSDGLMGLSFPLLTFGWLVGASSIGAEWGNRTVSALLTWEPRRTRVLLAKAAAASVSTGLWVVALEVVWTAVMLPVASGGDDVRFGGPFSWSEHVGVGARILLVSMFASILGFALATIGKNTGAALGGGMAYLLIVESLVRTYKSDWSDWLLSTNIVRVIEGTAEQVGLDGQSTAEAAGLLAAYAGGLFLVALWVFRRREMA